MEYIRLSMPLQSSRFLILIGLCITQPTCMIINWWATDAKPKNLNGSDIRPVTILANANLKKSASVLSDW